MKMRKYEVTLLNKEVVLVTAPCPSLAIAQVKKEYGVFWIWDIKCAK